MVERGAAGTAELRPAPGAAGARSRATDPDALAYTSFWWSGSEPRGWGFVISPREAAHCANGWAAAHALELEVEIESRAFDTRIPLVTALAARAAPRRRSR